jgi:hypothetical protein
MDKRTALKYLHSIMGNNKAMGLVAQADFQKWVQKAGDTVRRKYFNGCWVMSPKGHTATRRMCFFVHDKIQTKKTQETVLSNLQKNVGFHALCGSILRSGLGVFYVIPIGDEKTTNLDTLNWSFFRYHDESFEPLNGVRFFKAWPGNGRRGFGRPWRKYVRERYDTLSREMLESLALNQAFFDCFVKGKMRKPVADAYDVDGFFVSYQGKIVPLEIKEKFPFEANKIKLLGIDAGRILMLLRFTLPLDCNGLYVIREVEDTRKRKFVGWKMASLDSIIMNCNWTLQAGGRGMTGGPTQTVTWPYVCFSNVKSKAFSDDGLEKLSSMSKAIKKKSAAFQVEVEKFIQSAVSRRVVVVRE